MAQLILLIEVELVPSNHCAVAHADFAWNLAWCSVLLSKSDILAIATPQGWMVFLTSIQFSSPAAIVLGLPAQVRRHIDSH